MRRGNALPEVIQENSNNGRNVTVHEAGLSPGGSTLLVRQAHGNHREQKHHSTAIELIHKERLWGFCLV